MCFSQTKSTQSNLISLDNMSIFLLLLACLPFSFSQCATCSALGNGFCPSTGGATSGSQCNSCSLTTITGCQTCGGGSSCYSSLAACNAACGPASTTTTSSTTTPASGLYLITKFYSQDTTCSRTETMWLISQVYLPAILQLHALSLDLAALNRALRLLV